MGAEEVVVERIRGRNGWWKRAGYRVITVYSDGSRIYRRPFGRTVLQRGDRVRARGPRLINDYQWKRHRNSDNGRDGRDGGGGDDDRDRKHDRIIMATGTTMGGTTTRESRVGSRESRVRSRDEGRCEENAPGSRAILFALN